MKQEIKEAFQTAILKDDLETVVQLAKKEPKLLKEIFYLKTAENEMQQARLLEFSSAFSGYSQTFGSAFAKKFSSYSKIVLPTLPTGKEKYKEINVLMLASLYGATKVAPYFIKKKVPLEMDDGLSSLELATLQNQKEMVDLLFQKSSSLTVAKAIYQAIIQKNFDLAFHLEQKNKPLSLSFWPTVYDLYYGFFKVKEVIKRRFLKQGVQVQDVLKNSERHLVLEAIYQGDIALLKWLKGQKIDILKENKTKHVLDVDPLSFAVLLNQKEVASFLIDEGALVNHKNHLGFSPLHVAAKFDLKDMAELLIDRGAFLEMKTPSAQEKANWISPKNLSETPLLTASKAGALRVAELLIEKGADVNSVDEEGQTPLMKAVIMKDKEMAMLLLKAGADLSHRDKNFNTALLLASQMQDNEMFSLLKSPQQKQYKEMAELLLEAGADLSLSDKNFNIALLLAAKMQGKDMFSLLKSWQEKQFGLNVRLVQTKQKFPLMNKANEHIKE